SFGDMARREPVTTTSCNAVSLAFAADGAVCAYAGATADAAAAANTARTAYCSLVFPIMFSLGLKTIPSLSRQRVAFIPRPLHLYEDYNMPPDGCEAIWRSQKQ